MGGTAQTIDLKVFCASGPSSRGRTAASIATILIFKARRG